METRADGNPHQNPAPTIAIAGNPSNPVSALSQSRSRVRRAGSDGELFRDPSHCRYRRLTFPAALDFDDEFLHDLRLTSFNPVTQGPSDLELLFTLDRAFGPGLTRTQFRQIMKRCTLCNNVCFRERRHSHRCDGAVLLTQGDRFNFVSSLMTRNTHAGLSLFDLSRLFARCGRCDRICSEGVVFLHDCPA